MKQHTKKNISTRVVVQIADYDYVLGTSTSQKKRTNVEQYSLTWNVLDDINERIYCVLNCVVVRMHRTSLDLLSTGVKMFVINTMMFKKRKEEVD
jgi:hypothetical protein